MTVFLMCPLGGVGASLLSRATRPDKSDAAKGFKCLRELRRACAMEE